MAATAGMIMYGSSFSWNGSPLGELIGFDGPDDKVSVVEMTHAASPNGAAEYLPGIAEGGQMKISLNATAAAAAILHAAKLAKTVAEAIITLPSGESYTADDAFIVQCPISGSDVKGKVTQEVMVQSKSATWTYDGGS